MNNYKRLAEGFAAGSTLSTYHVEKSVHDNFRHVATAHDNIGRPVVRIVHTTLTAVLRSLVLQQRHCSAHLLSCPSSAQHLIYSHLSNPATSFSLPHPFLSRSPSSSFSPLIQLRHASTLVPQLLWSLDIRQAQGTASATATLGVLHPRGQRATRCSAARPGEACLQSLLPALRRERPFP
ncbi:hypothetical protein DAEQUDRAFT_276554 [Daedalea quercina L-15889]|uniref:Uncharacterized protein n=1 Tax=Daedalea quercina L-15889 TaxID=1314783 RepID=A0A165Q7J1_9APHY|nr:hypothetical protein DAEQUDRAFT_276554 [Daedalea quercina L-15889]